MFYHVGDSQHAPNKLINKVVGENKKMWFLFGGQNHMDFGTNPII